MSRYRGPRLRIIRRLGKLPGLTAKKPKSVTPWGVRSSLEKYIKTPGQHGKTKNKIKKSSSRISLDYRIRLEEKQKLRFNYGISERQLQHYVKQAKSNKGSTGELLLQFLEMRLDNIVFRLGLAPTISAAKQFITHGHITVNNKKVNLPSYQCQEKDIISILDKEASYKLALHNLKNFQDSNRRLPPFLSFNPKEFSGIIRFMANRNSVGLGNINELAVIEYYSR
jgi:small subunit ribosomal protein S4